MLLPQHRRALHEHGADPAQQFWVRAILGALSLEEQHGWAVHPVPWGVSVGCEEQLDDGSCVVLHLLDGATVAARGTSDGPITWTTFGCVDEARDHVLLLARQRPRDPAA